MKPAETWAAPAETPRAPPVEEKKAAPSRRPSRPRPPADKPAETPAAPPSAPALPCARSCARAGTGWFRHLSSATRRRMTRLVRVVLFSGGAATRSG